MYPCGIGGLIGSGAFAQAQTRRDAAQLSGQVLPFPDSQVVQELLATHPAEGAAGQPLPLIAQVVPQVEVGGEIGVLVGEAGVLLPGGLLPVGGSLPRVGNRQRGREHQHLTQTAFGIGLQHHPAESGVDRQLGQAAPDIGDGAGGVERPEFLQQLHTVTDAAPIRRVQEREVLHIAELQRGHLQQHRREIGAQDLRIGVARPGFEVLLGVQPDAHPRCGAPGSTGPLRGRGL